jgi:alkaline phosphatase D
MVKRTATQGGLLVLALSGCGGAGSGVCGDGGIACDLAALQPEAAVDGAVAAAGDLATGGPLPAPPQFPATIGTLTVGLRTGTGPFDGTNSNTLSLCLNATACMPLNLADVDDFRVGGYDVYHFPALNLPRSAVDRVELRSQNGTDAYRPACVELRFDGEPVHCEDQLGGVTLGSGSGERASVVDPLGLHNRCVTCAPSTLTHGPMVGAVTQTEARLLVRTDATRQVDVTLVDADQPAAAAVALARVFPSPERDFTQEVVLSGLQPGRRYEARVAVDNVASSRTARVRTQPARAAGGPLRFAFGSCARVESQPIFATLRQRLLDLFVFVGDNHYGNTPDRDSLRFHYRKAWALPDRAALLSEVSTIATWDDHDFVGNNSNGTSPGAATALRVFKEYWANPSAGTSSTPGTFFRHRVGEVEFFLVDDRTYRSPASAATGTILGAAQTAWLLDALESSTAVFKFIGSGSTFQGGLGEAWQAERPGELSALLDEVKARRIGGVVLLSGDIHRSAFHTIDRAAQGGYDVPELTSSPLANLSPPCAPTAAGATRLACTSGDNFFVEVDVDTSLADPTLTARIVDESGATRATWTLKRSSLVVP